MSRKEYLGDAVYVEFDGYALVLTTEDGRRATNRIVMEPSVYFALVQFAARLNQPPAVEVQNVGDEPVTIVDEGAAAEEANRVKDDIP